MLSEPEMLEKTEILLLLEGIYKAYGYDFRNYNYDIIKCRILGFIRNEHLSTISSLQDRLLHDPHSMSRFADAITINYTSMFADPEFSLVLRKSLVPILKTYPSVRIWLSGCATGQEAYALAILLHEENLYERSRIYATDVSETALMQAKAGIISSSLLKEYDDNYVQAGGMASLSDYYSTNSGNTMFHPWLKKNIIFAQHNLVTDQSFNEFNLILARNALFYFDSDLRVRVLELIHESLTMFGIVALGKKETLQGSVIEKYYEEFDPENNLYRRCV